MRYFASIVSPVTSCSGKGHGRKAVKLDFSAAFHMVSHCGLL